jgi:hypothetical protein
MVSTKRPAVCVTYGYRRLVQGNRKAQPAWTAPQSTSITMLDLKRATVYTDAPKIATAQHEGMENGQSGN